MQQQIIIEAEEVGKRLDAVLAARLEGFSRSRVQALIDEGAITKGGQRVSASQKAKLGEAYVLEEPEAVPSAIVPVAMPLAIVFEDEDMLVIDKPAGLTVHPAAGNTQNTLVNGLLAYCGDSLSGIGGVVRPGIVHRLDKDTSGLMVVAKHDRAHHALAAQLADRTLKRVYRAMVWGCPHPAQGVIEGNIGRSPADRKKMALLKEGGKEAITDHGLVEAYCAMDGKDSVVVSQVECRLRTGRTHQIRVHMAHVGHALVGDPLYGGASVASRLSRWNTAAVPLVVREALQRFDRQALHAKEIAFIHPTRKELLHFSCPFPPDWVALQEVLTQALVVSA